ncbi:helix-turn-helix domain-containing protein [Microbispora sp. RL4-1S]|uniref:Helix-turn-helix domain-containing protein n=1 Tax=Microbispora oryzae TaxID=2806554 RepID=A0A941AJF3_9ACTN|nr:helix-turn-helix domain-containing protein [Microbispora oryzae]MBP2706270.1 helix-turn-helix domain-containing protein [Microbispora oryzae]
MSGDDPEVSALARRLRELRENRWPGVRVTQPQLAAALGVSVPLVSSWESRTSPRVPPMNRIEGYATFFATSRPATEGHPLSPSDLTAAELDERAALLSELTRLRRAAQRAQNEVAAADGGLMPSDVRRGPWHFADGEPITIICSVVPPERREKIPYAHPGDPDYIELYKYSDLDSLFELHGHLRAANPTSLVSLRSNDQLTPDDLTTHLVLLGGVDWNRITASVLGDIEAPVRQVAHWSAEDGVYFEVTEGGDTRRHHPVTEGSGASLRLIEDVAFFYRGENPYNVERTLSMCNGMYARGVLGAVRALTDERFRDRNADYLHRRFGDARSYSVLSRVQIVGGVVITPDWTLESVRLHEWP